jgi:CTP synthase
MPKNNHKYVFVMGGVMSGVGKGISSASIGSILQDKGYRVNLVKADPYLNVDAGTMNPTEHGEVFVLRDGLETDQDLGNYERFLNKDQSSADYITSGMVYRKVIERERRLEYGGRCVEAIPHIRDEIIERFQEGARASDSEISVVEIGGTVGDYQNALFIEAARVLNIYNPNNVLFILVTYLPIPHTIGEMKTKPTQNAVRQLNSYGVQADVLIARSEIPLDEKRKQKIAISCNVYPEKVISAPDIESIYDVPINFEASNLGDIILSGLSLEQRNKGGLASWRAFVEKTKNHNKKIRIAVIGKYFNTGDFVLSDAYVSVLEAIKFSSYELGAYPEIEWLNSRNIENDDSALDDLAGYDGVVIPGGFGSAGVDGKLDVIRYVREHNIPCFGLCYGMQLMLIEYARSVLGFKDAHSTEVDPKTSVPIVTILESQKENVERQNMGGTMRLGTYETVLKPNTIAATAYGKGKIEERHRHRYEINPRYREDFERSGIIFSGMSPDGTLAEIAELKETEHPFFLGTQFHPEFQARPLAPHPLFTAFVKACLKRKGK